jgi:hypothetical protein
LSVNRWIDLPVILDIGRVPTPVLTNNSIILRLRSVDLTEQEGRERVASTKVRVAALWDAGLRPAYPHQP